MKDKKDVEEMVEENTDPNRYFQSKYLSPHLQGVNERLSKDYAQLPCTTRLTQPIEQAALLLLTISVMLLLV